jgi:hypothetical protein
LLLGNAVNNLLFDMQILYLSSSQQLVLGLRWSCQGKETVWIFFYRIRDQIRLEGFGLIFKTVSVSV